VTRYIISAGTSHPHRLLTYHHPSSTFSTNHTMSNMSEAPARLPTRPQYSLDSDKYSTSIKINKWTITSTKKPILNGPEIESYVHLPPLRFRSWFPRAYTRQLELICRAEKRLNLPLPEMTFGNNSLVLKFEGDEEVIMRFNGLEALAEVGVGEGWEERVGGGVLVSMAESWGKNR
jgi:type 2A phosphatase activator TIP41